MAKASLVNQEDCLRDYLVQRFGCTTIILYGSRATGLVNPTSDWDVFGLSPQLNEPTRFYECMPDLGEVAAYLFPASMAQPFQPLHHFITQPAEQFCRLRLGRCFIDPYGIGERIIQQANEVWKAGPTPSAPYFVSQQLATLRKTLPQIFDQTQPVLSLRMRGEMFAILIRSIFIMRREWGMGTKQDILRLERDDPEIYSQLQHLTEATATQEDWEKLACKIYGVSSLNTPNT
jgi:uncharacterized protein